MTGLALILGPLLLGSVEHEGRVVLMALAASSLVVGLVGLWIEPSRKYFFPPATLVLMGFLLWNLVGLTRSTNLNPAIRQFYLLLAYAVYFLVCVSRIHQPKSILLVVGSVVCVACLNSFYGLYQYMTQSNQVWWFVKPEHFVGRASGTYLCPNHYVGFLEMAFGLGLGYTLTGRLGIVSRLLFGYATLVIAAGIAVSVSRGGWIATFASCFIFLILLVRNPRFRWPVVGLVVLFLGVGLLTATRMEVVKERFSQVSEGGTVDDVRSRFWIWRAAYRMWQDRPWAGYGPGQFEVHFPQYRPKEIQWAPLQVHNDYLNLLVDHGVIGFGILSLFAGCIVWGCHRCWRSIAGDPTDYSYSTSNRLALGIGSVTGLTAILTHALVDFNFYIPANALLAVVLIGMLSTLYRYGTSRYWWEPGKGSKIICTLFGMIVVWALFQESIKQAREVRWLNRGIKAPTLEAALGPLERAYRINPLNDLTAYGIGERLRKLSWQGGATYEEQAELAMKWFEQGARINPLNRHCYWGIGMCLDWLKRHEEAEAYYLKALELDPNNFWQLAQTGVHYLYLRDYETARAYFERSLEIQWWENQDATYYLNLIKRRLGE